MATNTIDVNPGILNLELYAGDGIKFSMLFKDSNGLVIDISGTVEAEVRVSRLAADPPKVEFAVDLSEGALGIVKFSLTGDQTQTLSEDPSSSNGIFKGVWDVQWTAVGEQPRTICQGNVGCGPDVTR